MSAISPIVKPVSQMQLAPGSVLTIPDVSWDEFELILEEMGEKRTARIAYSRGILEIMVPLPEHEKPKELISDIVKILLRRTGRRYEPFGSTTFKRSHSAGVEPDACFYIQNYQQMIGRRRLEPDDPPPDFAIESDVTSKTTLEAYEALRVPELWIYAKGELTIYALQAEGYRSVETSPTFANLPLKQLIPDTVERAWLVGTVQALEEFETEITRIVALS
ncbi:MAG: Uma2 family endonuclease [Desertifilum sp. SIO1I2]|nr:Uma2 family endonuclease [Desertifilum sp. SIO1I2]